MSFSLIRRFLSDESGAVTVDFVPLVAATVGLGLAVTGVVSGGVDDISTDISSTMSDTRIIQTTFPSERMQVIRSNDVIFTISGKELCAEIACDATQTYSQLSYSTTDGDQLTRYASYASGDEYWVTEKGDVLDYVPERAEGFCSGRCAPVVVDEPIRLIDKTPVRISARVPTQ